MFIIIRGAGDIASGVALRLYNCGFKIMMTEIEKPTAIRRTVSFSEAVYMGKSVVEGITSVLCSDVSKVDEVIESGRIPVVIDEYGEVLRELYPDCVIDARLAKNKLDTKITDAPIVIGLGPGFTAGIDCNAVVETNRGHSLGRVIYNGSAQKNTGIPGNIAGFTTERLLCAPCNGIIDNALEIGSSVNAGDVCAYVNGIPIYSKIKGTLRGMLRDGTYVYMNMKCGDVDPRGKQDYCNYVSDKALAIGGGVIEALLHLSEMIL